MAAFPSFTLLYFGSFNPIRTGHMAIAEAALQATGAEALWMVVSPQNPLKADGELAPERHRLNMARLAVDDSPLRDRIEVSDIEFSLEKPSLHDPYARGVAEPLSRTPFRTADRQRQCGPFRPLGAL